MHSFVVNSHKCKVDVSLLSQYMYYRKKSEKNRALRKIAIIILKYNMVLPKSKPSKTSRPMANDHSPKTQNAITKGM